MKTKLHHLFVTVLLASAQVLFFGCASKNNLLLQEMHETAKTQKDNPINSISYYEFLLEEHSNLTKKTPAENLETKKENNEALTSAVRRTIHYNLFIAYLQLFTELESTTLVKAKQTSTGAETRRNTPTSQYSNFQKSTYFAKAMVHLEMAAQNAETKELNDVKVYSYANLVRQSFGRISTIPKSFIDKIRAKRNAAYFSMYAFFLLMLCMVAAAYLKIKNLLFGIKKKMIFVVVLTIFTTYTSATATFIFHSMQPENNIAITTSSLIDLKQRPNAGAKNLAKLQSGERLEIIKSEGAWLMVKIVSNSTNIKNEELYGWIRDESLAFL